jgi:hypothetical protein
MISCISLEKDKVPDVKILSMSYLEYLMHLINKKITEEDKIVSEYLEYSFYQFLNLAIGVDQVRVKYDKNGKIFLSVLLRDNIEKKKWIDISRKEFDDIKDIVLFQNIPDYDNKYVNPDVQEEIDAVRAIENKNIEMPSLEMRKITLSLNSNYTLDSINGLTLRKFNLMLDQSDSILNYKIYKQAELGGMVTFKEKIGHYLYKNKKNKLGGALLDYGSFKDKMSKVAK